MEILSNHIHPSTEWNIQLPQSAVMVGIFNWLSPQNYLIYKYTTNPSSNTSLMILYPNELPLLIYCHYRTSTKATCKPKKPQATVSHVDPVHKMKLFQPLIHPHAAIAQMLAMSAMPRYLYTKCENCQKFPIDPTANLLSHGSNYTLTRCYAHHLPPSPKGDIYNM